MIVIVNKKQMWITAFATGFAISAILSIVKCDHKIGEDLKIEVGKPCVTIDWDKCQDWKKYCEWKELLNERGR